MEKQEFIEKNKSYINKTRKNCRRMLILNVIPKFIGSIVYAKRISKLMGIGSISKFLRTDSDEINRIYNNLDAETQQKVDALYDKLEPELDEAEEACDELTAELDKTEIPINIQNAIDPDWDDNEDEQMSQRVDSIKRAIIDEFFDGVDPVGDDDAE
jgi:hypothetical protein